MSLTVEHPGAFTTIQDLGRPGFRAAGVPLGGAADPLALRIANLLVGNAEGGAAIECALVGPGIRFQTRAIVAVCGAKPSGIPHWQPFEVRAGAVLSLSRLSDGAYAYLAIAGGIESPLVLNSRSTDARIGWGGIDGRPLRAGDALKLGRPRLARVSSEWRIDAQAWYDHDSIVRFVPGSQADEFDASWRDATFRASSRSDRMGVRLSGPVLTRNAAGDLASSPMLPGTIQVPPDGQPIVLLADAQTLGGYPKIGHVIGVDQPRVAQLRPGARVRFREVTIDEAHELARARARELAILRAGVAAKLQS